MNSVYYGRYLISGTKNLDLVPNELKSVTNLATLKKPPKNGHQRNALADFAKFLIVMSVLFEKRAR